MLDCEYLGDFRYYTEAPTEEVLVFFMLLEFSAKRELVLLFMGELYVLQLWVQLTHLSIALHSL